MSYRRDFFFYIFPPGRLLEVSNTAPAQKNVSARSQTLGKVKKNGSLTKGAFRLGNCAFFLEKRGAIEGLGKRQI